MTRAKKQPRKPQITVQYAVITSNRKAKCEDDSIVPVIDGAKFYPGDQGMVEWERGKWRFTLFEAAPRPNPQPKAQKPAQARTQPRRRIQTTAPPAEKTEAELAEERRQRLAKARATKEANARAQAETEAKERRQRAQAEWAEIDRRVEAAETAYEAAFQRAVKATGEEFDQAWHTADVKQSALIGMLNRKRTLAVALGQTRLAD